MIESCAIAYLKELSIAFMLFLIPILPYNANSVIFTIKMKSPMPTICPENSPLKKSEEIWMVKRSAFRLPTKIQWDIIKESLCPYGKQFEAPLSKRLLKHHQALLWIKGHDQKRPNQGRLAHSHHFRKHQVCKPVILQVVREEIVTCCANAA